MDTLFLVITLFFPRIVLLIYYVKGWLPLNTIPFWGDVLLGVFIPRLLILIYIYQNLGGGSFWFWLHLVVMIIAYSGGTAKASRRKKRPSD